MIYFGTNSYYTILYYTTESYQEVRRKLYSDDAICGVTAAISTTHPSTASGGGQNSASIVKGRVSRDAWLCVHRQLMMLSNSSGSDNSSGSNSAMPKYYGLLKQYDPIYSGSDIYVHIICIYIYVYPIV